MFFLLFLKESNAIWEPDGHLQQKQVWFPNWLPDLNMPVFCILTCQLNSERYFPHADQELRKSR